MKKNNLIRFVESLVLLPALTVSMPFGNIPTSNTNTYPQIVLSQKQNIGAQGLFAFNQAGDPTLQTKTQTLKMQADAIDAYFKEHDMPIAGLGMKMALEADKNSLDYRLLPAIAVRESTGGKFACKRTGHNFFGWGSCKIGFDSNEKAIETVALNLGGNNPSTASYYANKDVKQILHAYNPPSIIPRYAEQVMSIMDAIGREDTLAVNVNKVEV